MRVPLKKYRLWVLPRTAFWAHADAVVDHRVDVRCGSESSAAGHRRGEGRWIATRCPARAHRQAGRVLPRRSSSQSPIPTEPLRLTDSPLNTSLMPACSAMPRIRAVAPEAVSNPAMKRLLEIQLHRHAQRHTCDRQQNLHDRARLPAAPAPQITIPIKRANQPVEKHAAAPAIMTPSADDPGTVGRRKRKPNQRGPGKAGVARSTRTRRPRK